MSPLSAYLHSLREIHATGASVPETSYYGALETLLNEIGKTLKPRVRCVINLANRGAGIPDGGLFTAEQFQRGDVAPLPGQLPARGVIEVKPRGAIRPELRALAVLSHTEAGKPLDPAAGDLNLTAGWGHAGKGGVTMPGRGQLIERDYTPEEYAALGKTAASLGERTYDIVLNDHAYWRNIPARVWNYTLGGYQVIKKWLSYREKTLLGRSLKPEEAREVSYIARRIAAIVLMEAALDVNYRAGTAAESGLKSPPSLPPTG